VPSIILVTPKGRQYSEVEVS